MHIYIRVQKIGICCNKWGGALIKKLSESQNYRNTIKKIGPSKKKATATDTKGEKVVPFVSAFPFNVPKKINFLSPKYWKIGFLIWYRSASIE